MRYSGYELLWMFAVYSVAGWCLEVCAAAAKQKKFVNRGYLNGPFCPVYGLTSAAFGIVLPELKEHLIFLFLGGMIIAAFAEYICGFLLERISGQNGGIIPDTDFLQEGISVCRPLFSGESVPCFVSGCLTRFW